MISEKKIKSFIKFLEAAGAEILHSENEYEVVRFRANGTTSVIYQNKFGAITSFINEGETAFNAFLNNQPFKVEKQQYARKMRTAMKEQRRIAILKRDGCKCFFCGELMDDKDMTIEHLIPAAHGGTNHLTNLVLAHAKCNQMASHMSVMQKIKLREKFLFGEWSDNGKEK